MRRDRVVLLGFQLVVACSEDDASDAATAMTGNTAMVAAAAGHTAADTSTNAAPSGAGAAAQGGVTSTPVMAGSGSAGVTAAAGATAPARVEPVPGSCCPDGKCLCRGDAPSSLSDAAGPYTVMQHTVMGVGCVYYPSDAVPPFAAVAIADGFGGGGGCDSVQTHEWGPLYASHGIVAMIVETGTGAQPDARGESLTKGIAAFKSENEQRSSPLFGKLAGRYGTSGFAMGGGGAIIAAKADATLLSSVAVMPWGPVDDGVEVPTLIICGASDGIAPCSAYGEKAYASVGASVPKMRVTVMSEYAGQPSAAAGDSGAHALAFQKLFLEGDQRWRPLLIAAKSDETTIR
ncbi:MAG: hypothetical protein ABW321_17830 [Polyangiales bacterium]